MTPAATKQSPAARYATEEADLDRLALIGVFDTRADPTALVRTPSGNMKRVRVGDAVSGRDVVAIGDDRVILVRGASQTVLTMPKD